MAKPISRDVHALLDYGFAAANLAVPKLLGMSAKACLLYGGFGLVQGAVNSLTEHKYAIKKVIPFATHGKIDAVSAPVAILAPVLLGLHREPAARAYWIGSGAALVAEYFLTNWDSNRPFKGQGGALGDRY